MALTFQIPCLDDKVCLLSCRSSLTVFCYHHSGHNKTQNDSLLRCKLSKTLHIPVVHHLTELNLNSNHLTVLPKEIGNLVNLTELDISDNYLNELPKEIGNLVHLTKLDISGNNLTELPEEIVNLVNLNLLTFNYQVAEDPEDWWSYLHKEILLSTEQQSWVKNIKNIETICSQKLS